MSRIAVDHGAVRIDHITRLLRHTDVEIYRIQLESKGPRVITSPPNELHFLALDPEFDEGRTLYLDKRQLGVTTTVHFLDYETTDYGWDMEVTGGGYIFTVFFFFQPYPTDDVSLDPAVVWSATSQNEELV